MESKGQPRACFPEIVSAANKVESPAVGDPTNVRARRSQVHQSDVRHQVEELKQQEEAHRYVEIVITRPSRWLIVRMEEKVHSEEAEYAEVSKAVLEEISQGHSL